MTTQEIKHVENRLMIALDTIVSNLSKGAATPEEIAALPEIASDLIELEKI